MVNYLFTAGRPHGKHRLLSLLDFLPNETDVSCLLRYRKIFIFLYFYFYFYLLHYDVEWFQHLHACFSDDTTSEDFNFWMFTPSEELVSTPVDLWTPFLLQDRLQISFYCFLLGNLLYGLRCIKCYKRSHVDCNVASCGRFYCREHFPFVWKSSGYFCQDVEINVWTCSRLCTCYFAVLIYLFQLPFYLQYPFTASSWASGSRCGGRGYGADGLWYPCKQRGSCNKMN